MTDPTTDSLVARITALEAQVAELTVMLLALGSATIAGGPPGPKRYLAWHDEQMVPPPPPAETVKTGAAAAVPQGVGQPPGSSQASVGQNTAQGGASASGPTSAIPANGSPPQGVPTPSPGSNIGNSASPTPLPSGGAAPGSPPPAAAPGALG